MHTKLFIWTQQNSKLHTAYRTRRCTLPEKLHNECAGTLNKKKYIVWTEIAMCIRMQQQQQQQQWYEYQFFTFSSVNSDIYIYIYKHAYKCSVFGRFALRSPEWHFTIILYYFLFHYYWWWNVNWANNKRASTHSHTHTYRPTGEMRQKVLFF